MPLGTVKILGDRGSIQTEPPQPVTYIKSRYPTIGEGAWVYFERRSDDPTKARLVRLATKADELLALATPLNGLTPAAKAFIQDLAKDHLDNLGALESADEKAAGEAAVRKALGGLAARLARGDGRVGVALARAALAESIAEA